MLNEDIWSWMPNGITRTHNSSQMGCQPTGWCRLDLRRARRGSAGRSLYIFGHTISLEQSSHWVRSYAGEWLSLLPTFPELAQMNIPCSAVWPSALQGYPVPVCSRSSGRGLTLIARVARPRIKGSPVRHREAEPA